MQPQRHARMMTTFEIATRKAEGCRRVKRSGAEKDEWGKIPQTISASSKLSKSVVNSSSKQPVPTQIVVEKSRMAAGNLAWVSSLSLSLPFDLFEQFQL